MGNRNIYRFYIILYFIVKISRKTHRFFIVLYNYCTLAFVLYVSARVNILAECTLGNK